MQVRILHRVLNNKTMTAKEKAEELFEKYRYEIFSLYKNPIMYLLSDVMKDDYTKQCALIAVDAILDDKRVTDGMRVINDSYWIEVKQELEKL